MSDIVRSEGQHSTYAGLTVDIAEDTAHHLRHHLGSLEPFARRSAGH